MDVTNETIGTVLKFYFLKSKNVMQSDDKCFNCKRLPRSRFANFDIKNTHC